MSCVAAVSTTVHFTRLSKPFMVLNFDPWFKAIRFLYIVQCIFLVRKSLKTSFDWMFSPTVGVVGRLMLFYIKTGYRIQEISAYSWLAQWWREVSMIIPLRLPGPLIRQPFLLDQKPLALVFEWHVSEKRNTQSLFLCLVNEGQGHPTRIKFKTT